MRKALHTLVRLEGKQRQISTFGQNGKAFVSDGSLLVGYERKLNSVISGGQWKRTGTETVPIPGFV